MAPIASRSPNAFNKPLAMGEPTATNGTGTVELPPGIRLYVRTIDPTLAYFPANFFEVLPTQGTKTESMDIAMAPAASLRATVHAPDGTPLADGNVKMMMSHPTRGPWWPADADTDAQGHLHFPTVPPGTYILVLNTDAGRLEIPDVKLPPGGEADLGTVRLH
jgi:hypothetical protein